MRFGCCAGLDQIQAIQDAGYDYIELAVNTVKAEQPDSEFEPTREALEEFDIRPEAWNCLLPGNMKVVGPDADSYRIERFLRTAFERIEKLGGEVVVFGSGGARKVPEGFPMDEARYQLAEALTLAGRVAGAHGITIALEPLNHRETNIINTVREGAEIVRIVSHPFVKLLVDLYHVQSQGELLSDISVGQRQYVHAHTADTDRLYPGSGSYPNLEFIEALRAAGYDDRLSVECSWRDFNSECVKALEYLRGLI